MDLISYLRIFRQRWLLVALPCLAAALAAVLTMPEEQAAGPQVTTYQATATLITSPTVSTDSTQQLSLATVALFVTTGEIPERVAKLLDYPGEPQVLASQVTVTPNSETGTLTIATSDAVGNAAARRVNTFADVTVAYFREQQSEQDRARIEVLNRQLSATSDRLEQLQARLGDREDPVLVARIQALQAQYGTQYAEFSGLNQRLGRASLLTVLQPGVPIPQTTTSGFVAPTNPLARLGIAVLLGLLLGCALALVVERLDSRMRTREQVEDATGLPVLAEIPKLPKAHRGQVVTAVRPASVVAEAFRALRSSVLLLNPGASRMPGRAGLTILVTSALPGEGKTTTVANLAAVMAEAGRRVLVLSLDLRGPRVHRFFHVTNGVGVSDLLAADRGRHLQQIVHPTDLAGVSIATSGQDLEHPGALLASVAPLITAARGLADVVLIDTPPILAVSDAQDLAPHVDVTLLVCRLNKTTRTQAEECQRLFARLGVSALGTVLVASRPAGARYGYSLVGDNDMHAAPDTTDSSGSIRSDT